MKKKILSIFLTACLLVGYVPLSAGAAKTNITLGNSVSSSITSSTDKDFYKFTISESGHVAFNFNGTMQSIVLNLFDQNDQLLWSDSYVWNSVSKRIVVGREFDLISGTYYLCIAGYVSPIGGTYSSVGEYTLKTSYDSSNETFKESNESNDDKIETSNQISFGKRYYGQIAFTEEKDFYKLTFAAPKTINVVFNGTIEYINLYIFDGNFHQKWDKFGYANSSSRKIVIDENIHLDAGTYYLGVQKAMHVQIGDRTGNYSFTLKENSANTDDPSDEKTSVSLNRSSLTLTEGETETLTATVTPANAKDKSVTWSSSDTSVATVTSGGRVTAVFAGTATITAKTASGATARCLVTVKAEGDDKPFLDVPTNAYYYKAACWAKENGVMAGDGKGHLTPEKGCTRAEVVQVLKNLSGESVGSSDSSFTDVPNDAWYSAAVEWAVANGITSGTGGGKFSPNAKCTRAQIVTFLWNYAGKPTVSSGSSFSDVRRGEYYENAVKWAVANGITSGTGNGKFSPNATCTRGQIVTFLYKYAG